MKIVKDDFNKTIYPPVKIKCPHCDSIIIIENGDAYLNKHYVWNWICPCCKKPQKAGCRWQLILQQEEKYRGKRAQVAIDNFMIDNQDLLILNEEEIEEMLEHVLKKDIIIKPKDEFYMTSKKE